MHLSGLCLPCVGWGIIIFENMNRPYIIILQWLDVFIIIIIIVIIVVF